MHDSFLAKIKRFGLPSEDIDLVSSKLGTPYDVVARADIATPGNAVHDLHVLVEGWACQYHLMGEGRRQVLAILLPGEICNLSRLFDRNSKIGVTALADCKVAALSVEWLRDIRVTQRAMADLFWHMLCREHAAMTEQIVALGRRSSRQRIAYLICDVLERLQALGQAKDGRFRSPLTQTDIADTLGLSTVHVNRTLQGLREDGLIEMRGRSLCVPRQSALQHAASYDGAPELESIQV